MFVAETGWIEEVNVERQVGLDIEVASGWK